MIVVERAPARIRIESIYDGRRSPHYERWLNGRRVTPGGCMDWSKEDVRSVAVSGNGSVTVSAERQKGRQLDTLSVTDTGGASPDFEKAITGLIAPTAKILGFPKGYTEGMTCRGLTLSQQGESGVGLIVKLSKPIEIANGPFNPSTPLILARDENGSRLPKSLEDAVDTVLELGVAFLKGGERATGELFGDEGGAEEAEEAEEATEEAVAAH